MVGPLEVFNVNSSSVFVSYNVSTVTLFKEAEVFHRLAVLVQADPVASVNPPRAVDALLPGLPKFVFHYSNSAFISAGYGGDNS